MQTKLRELLRCPQTGGRLFLEKPEYREDRIHSGWLVSEGGTHRYAIQNFIPRFVPSENYAESFGYQWNMHRLTQVDSHTGLHISRERVAAATRWPQRLDGQHILEAGSGAGRFTEILLATGATVYSFDYSSAVDANSANNGAAPNLHLFQGDIYDIPLPKAQFDKVICLGVLQHTPDPLRAFNSLAGMVRPGGELVIDVYTLSLAALLQWKYLLRPITKRLPKETLYKIVTTCVSLFLPLATMLRRIAGRAGARLLPIVEYSHLGLPPELNRQWAILDTFDMYSPVHDHPQSLRTVQHWFAQAEFVDTEVRYGPNGVVGKGFRPLESRRQ